MSMLYNVLSGNLASSGQAESREMRAIAHVPAHEGHTLTVFSSYSTACASGCYTIDIECECGARWANVCKCLGRERQESGDPALKLIALATPYAHLIVSDSV